jgi:hypothetical protein
MSPGQSPDIPLDLFSLAELIDRDSRLTQEERGAIALLLQERRDWRPSAHMNAEKIAQEILARGTRASENPIAYGEWLLRTDMDLAKDLKEAARHFSTAAAVRALLVKRHRLQRSVVRMNSNEEAELRMRWMTFRATWSPPSYQEFSEMYPLSTGEQDKAIAKSAQHYKTAMKRALGRESHRPKAHADRDWELTRLVIEGGRTVQEARKQWRAKHPDYPVTARAAEEAIRRTEQAVRADFHERCLLIFALNLTVRCPRCRGSKGKVESCERCARTGLLPRPSAKARTASEGDSSSTS